MSAFPLASTYADLRAQLAAAQAERDAAQVAIAGLAGVVAERDAALAKAERLVACLEEWCAEPVLEATVDGQWVDVVSVSVLRGLVEGWRAS